MREAHLTETSLLTPEQVATSLNLSLRTILTKRWRVAHGLRGVHIGRSLRFRSQDIAKIIELGLEHLPGEARR